jgi:viroplasmin and RNaseH domain-containing protein
MQIPTMYSGPEGVLQDVHEIPGACYKLFRTREQAEAFIEDWKEAYAEVWRRAVKEALDEGLRPQNMKLDTKEVLREANQDSAVEGISQRFDSVISFM